LEEVQVPKDGDCIFVSVMHGLSQLSHEETQRLKMTSEQLAAFKFNLKPIGKVNKEKNNAAVLALRAAVAEYMQQPEVLKHIEAARAEGLKRTKNDQNPLDTAIKELKKRGSYLDVLSEDVLSCLASIFGFAYRLINADADVSSADSIQAQDKDGTLPLLTLVHHKTACHWNSSRKRAAAPSPA
jgi:hypothetical protein